MYGSVTLQQDLTIPFVPDKPGYADLKADTIKIFSLIRVKAHRSI
jgi:hypothetical protein